MLASIPGRVALFFFLATLPLVATQAQSEVEVCGYAGNPAPRRTSAPLTAPPPTPIIPVVFHLAQTHDGTPQITDAQVFAQIDALDNAVARAAVPTSPRIRFVLAGIHRFPAPPRSAGTSTRDYAEALSTQYDIDRAHVINVYVAPNNTPVAGLVTASLSFVFVQTQSFAGYPRDGGPSRGSVLIHEMGHALGLGHTFFGGCTDSTTPSLCPFSGDLVCDTPPAADRGMTNIACDETLNTCLDFGGPGGTDQPDDVHNYMDYACDACKTRFTNGQYDKMQTTLAYEGQSFLQSDGRTIALPAGLSVPADQAWAFYSVTLQMGAGSRIAVRGSFNATRLAGGPGVVLTTATPGARWHGVRYEPGATGVFTDVTVSRVDRYGEATTDPPPAVPYYGAVEVNGATFTMTRGGINQTQLGNGLMATGPAAVSLTNTRIREADGAGLVASGGVKVTLSGLDMYVERNRLGGIRASGYNTLVTLNGNAHVDYNLAYGATATYGAQINISSAPTLPTSISNNRGGLDAQAGSSITGGRCTSAGCQPSGRYASNTDYVPGSASYPCIVENGAERCDARALGGSVIVAQYAFWGGQQTRSDLRLSLAGKSVIDVEPLLASDPAGSAGDGLARGPASPLASLTPEDAPAGGAATAGRRNADVTLFTAGARQAARDGDWTSAFALAQQATTLSADPVLSDDEDRAAAYGTAEALFAMSSAGPEAQPALSAFETESLAGGLTAPWARRALAVARAAGGNPAASDALASALTIDADAGHRAFGFGQRVRLAVEAGRTLGDSSAAVARLAEFAAGTDGMGDEDLAVLGESTALVVAAFPGALAGGGLARGVERGLIAASRSVTPAERNMEASTRAEMLGVSPNPASGMTAVRLSGTAAGAHVEVVVYDALGRRVAALYDGAPPDGNVRAALDTSALPVGLYVVRAVVTHGTESETFVRRLLVVR